MEITICNYYFFVGFCLNRQALIILKISVPKRLKRHINDIEYDQKHGAREKKLTIESSQSREICFKNVFFSRALDKKPTNFQ